MNLFSRIKEWLHPPAPPALVWHPVIASSFADHADVCAFLLCKDKGGTDLECFKVGDNGIGFFDAAPCWRDDILFAALPRDVWLARWGNAQRASQRQLAVRVRGQIYIGTLGDTLPWLRNIKPGRATLDLNPGFARAFGLRPPFLVNAEWAWVDPA